MARASLQRHAGKVAAIPPVPFAAHHTLAVFKVQPNRITPLEDTQTEPVKLAIGIDRPLQVGGAGIGVAR